MIQSPKWHWRVNCGPGLYGITLNGERFLIHTLPVLEPRGEDEYVMTVQIQIRLTGGHHCLELVDLDGNQVPVERLMREQVHSGPRDGLYELGERLFGARRPNGEAHQEF
jgi:hypothetical protein